MPEPQVLPLNSFRSGLITRVPANQIPDDGFSDVGNIDLNEKFLPIKAKGHDKYNSVTLGANPCRGGGLYAKADGTRYYVFAFGGKIYYSIAGTGTFTAYQIDVGGSPADLTVDPDSDVEMVQYLDKLWLLNGKYPIITNSGYATSKMIRIDGIVPSSVTVADLPQGGVYPVMHQERLFILGSLDQANGIYWSLPYDPETWTPLYGLNYDFVGKDDGEVITGGASYQGYLYVGKPRNIYRYMTLGDITQWQSQRVDTHFGWLYHRTIREFFGRLIYLSPNGVVTFDGNSADPISDQIRDKILELPQMIIGTRSWLQTFTADFDTGTVPDVTDTADDEIKTKSIVLATPKTDTLTADFAAGEIKTRMDTSGDELKGKVDSASLLSSFESHNIGVSTLDNNAQSFQLTQDTYLNSISLLGLTSAGGTWTVSIRLDSGGNPGGIIKSVGLATTYDGGVAQWYSFALGGILLKANTTYWIYSQASSPTQIWRINNAGGYASGHLWSSTHGHTAWDATFRIYGEYGANSIFVSREHDTGVEENGYTWDAIDSGQVLPAGSSAVYQIAAYDTSGTLWDDIPGGQIETVADGATPTIARKRYIRWRAVLISAEGLFTATKITDFNIFFFSGKTLDYKYDPASLGRLLSTVTGSITFKTKTSATDLSEADWKLAAGWTALAGDGTIQSSIERYMRINTIAAVGATITDLKLGAIEFRSVNRNLGVTPGDWGLFESAHELNGQTITFWMRSAATEGPLAAATWYQQTAGVKISSVTLHPWVQTALKLTTTDISQIPVVGSFKINYFVGGKYSPPIAIVWGNDYWLNVVEPDTLINNLVYKFNKNGYWLLRKNKKNNVYFIDGNNLVSGTSESDGFTRLNDVGTKDDTTDIDSYFVTKNFGMVPMVKLFREMFVTSKSDAAWTFSYSLDGAAYTVVTMALKALVDTVRKIFTGITSGRFIKFKIQQSNEDGNWEFHGADVLWRPWRQLNNE